jgi:hypothetical protein
VGLICWRRSRRRGSTPGKTMRKRGKEKKEKRDNVFLVCFCCLLNSCQALRALLAWAGKEREGECDSIRGDKKRRKFLESESTLFRSCRRREAPGAGNGVAARARCCARLRRRARSALGVARACCAQRRCRMATKRLGARSERPAAGTAGGKAAGIAAGGGEGRARRAGKSARFGQFASSVRRLARQRRCRRFRRSRRGARSKRYNFCFFCS